MHTADFRCVSIGWKLVVLFLNLNLGLLKIWPKRPIFYLPTRDECAHSPVILIKVFDLCRSQDSETTILSHIKEQEGCCCDFGFSTTLKMPLPPFQKGVFNLVLNWTSTQPRPVENWERRPLKLWRALQVRHITLMTPPPPVGGSTVLDRTSGFPARLSKTRNNRCSKLPQVLMSSELVRYDANNTWVMMNDFWEYNYI